MSRLCLATIVVITTLNQLRAEDPPKLALLVGCTEYQNPQIRELYGPGNDVPMWAELLTDPKGFAFPKQNVKQLVGWPAESYKRPTHDNIKQGFEDLIKQAQAGSRVFILMSGHGVQVPIPDAQKDPLDPRNPEPDGLDEIFLPADAKSWGKDGVVNAIKDDQIGTWLDKLRAKGAHVLIVFDSCHAGTMTRGPVMKGGPDPRNPEIDRSINLKDVGVTIDMIAKASIRGHEAVAAARKAGKVIPGEENVVAAADMKGSLVAFYAAQPFEPAPELPLPEGRPIARENYYGMLSFTLVKAIKQRQSKLSYGDLQRIVVAAYRESRATSPPTPYAEGDLNREVLGLAEWPKRPAIGFEKDRENAMRVNAGALHGLTKGSILSVSELGAADAKALVGHVRVESVTASDGVVVPVEFAGKTVAAAKFPSLGKCEVVVKEFGDFGVKVYTEFPLIRAALGKLDKNTKAMIRLVPTEQEAEWVLRLVAPKDVDKEYDIKNMKKDEIFLLQGTGQTINPKQRAPQADGASKRTVFGRYPADDEPGLIGAIGLDLPKIYTWQNVWRVASGVASAEGGETHGLTLEVVKIKGKAAIDGELLLDGRLMDKQDVMFRAKNNGSDHLWVSAFYLEANLGITRLYSAGVKRGQTAVLNKGRIGVGANAARVEGVVLFAVPQSVAKEQPDFEVIVQKPLANFDTNKGDKVRGGTAFDRLLGGAAINKGTREYTPYVNSTPAILTQSWSLVPIKP